MIDHLGRVLYRNPLKQITILKNKNIPLTEEQDIKFEAQIDWFDPVNTLRTITKPAIAKKFEVSNLVSFSDDRQKVTFEVVLNENGKEPSAHDIMLYKKGVISLYRQKYTFDVVLNTHDNNYKHVIFSFFDPFIKDYTKDYDFVRLAVPDLIRGYDKDYESILSIKDKHNLKLVYNLDTKFYEIYWFDILLYSINEKFKYLVEKIMTLLHRRYEAASFSKLMEITKATKKQTKECAKWLVDQIATPTSDKLD